MISLYISFREIQMSVNALKMELKEWYGSAALVMIPEIHQKIQKTGFD